MRGRLRPQIKKTSSEPGKLSLLRVTKYLSFFVGTIILICLFVFIFFPDPIINSLFKDRITADFTKAYPSYSIKLGKLHYNVWKNRLGCDSITLNINDLSCRAVSFSISGMSWMKIIRQRNITSDALTNSVIDAQNIILDFPKSQIGLRLKMLHLSLLDSVLTAESIKYYSLLNDEQLFAKSKFRQTRFRFTIPKIKITKLDCFALLQGNIYKAGSIDLNDLVADILVNMDKPYDITSTKPQMPNEALNSIKEIIKINNLKITNGRLNYCERYVVKEKPGIITFNKVNILVTGIANHTGRSETVVINGDGLFMNSGKIKLFMEIPLNSKKFSLRYSGSLSSMDVSDLNSFIEKSEHRRIKSGYLQSAFYNIDVNSGYAKGVLRVEYKDLSIAVLDKKTGSEKGIFNRIISLFGKLFVIRGNNIPDDKGLMKIGEIKYRRDPDDYFLQFLWFALRNGVGDVVGFPPKELSVK